VSKKTIAVFDMSVTSTSPVGSCLLKLVTALSNDYKFVVFADEFENPAPDCIDWVKVQAPKHPVFLRFIQFNQLAPKKYKRFVRETGCVPDLIIATEGEFPDCDVCYIQFCNQAYMKRQTIKLTSLRSIARLITRRFNGYTEAKALSSAKAIVTPSDGLARELASVYGSAVKDKIVKISNPVNVKEFTDPSISDTHTLRQSLGFSSDDTVLAFAALGDFERKGLTLVLEAVSALDSSVKLLVIGGTDSEIKEYQDICNQLEITDRVNFAGFQSDIRPYLWLSDLFVFPSEYETFSLVTFQAAIAGLPIIATRLYGVEDFLRHGDNGWQIERCAESIAKTVSAAIDSPETMKSVGAQAHIDASDYDIPAFFKRWQTLLDDLLV